MIGDVRDQQRLEFAIRDVDLVVHAAAMKQIGASEYNPFECTHINVIGAENVIRASIRSGVDKIVTLSTDKATIVPNEFAYTSDINEEWMDLETLRNDIAKKHMENLPKSDVPS